MVRFCLSTKLVEMCFSGSTCPLGNAPKSPKYIILAGIKPTFSVGQVPVAQKIKKAKKKAGSP
jgi:hypothetical protein